MLCGTKFVYIVNLFVELLFDLCVHKSLKRKVFPAQVWFSAQRLKHGVSWTPEEVEEARRKQFNGTVHTVPQTITVIPAHQLSAAANGLQSILQTCQIVGQPGLVFTQAGVICGFLPPLWAECLLTFISLIILTEPHQNTLFIRRFSLFVGRLVQGGLFQ